jgi:mannose-6-phosphate isomerase-like protein (cupin superfamily)
VERCIEHIRHQGIFVAVIIRAGYRKEGIEFFTPGSFSQQLAYMNRPVGYKISPHVHNEVRREVFHTQEVLFVRTGKVKVDFYSVEQDYLESRVLEPGDVILLASGGHGFEMLENTELIEVKQGPYSGDHDKVRFGPKK